MAQPQGLVLADIGDRAAVHVGGLEDLQQLVLALAPQFGLKLRGVVEIVLERALAARGHEDEFLDPRRPRLVDRVLDQRAVDQGHDLLRNRFRRRQEPRAQTRNRKDRLGHLLAHLKPPTDLQTAHAPLPPRARHSASIATAYSMISVNLCGSQRHLHKFRRPFGGISAPPEKVATRLNPERNSARTDLRYPARRLPKRWFRPRSAAR